MFRLGSNKSTGLLEKEMATELGLGSALVGGLVLDLLRALELVLERLIGRMRYLHLYYIVKRLRTVRVSKK